MPGHVPFSMTDRYDSRCTVCADYVSSNGTGCSGAGGQPEDRSACGAEGGALLPQPRPHAARTILAHILQCSCRSAARCRSPCPTHGEKSAHAYIRRSAVSQFILLLHTYIPDEMLHACILARIQILRSDEMHCLIR